MLFTRTFRSCLRVRPLTRVARGVPLAASRFCREHVRLSQLSNLKLEF